MANPWKEYTVLVVEDEDKIAKIIETYLNLYPRFKTIIRARDGMEAMQKLNNQEFDLIVTDLILPRRDGAAFIETLRKIPRYYNQKIVVVSGCLTDELAMKCIQNGVKNIIVKPFTARQILFKTISLLQAEDDPRKVVDDIIEKMAQRFLQKNNDEQRAILNEDVNQLEDLIAEDRNKKLS